jgi:hypothetical protein
MTLSRRARAAIPAARGLPQRRSETRSEGFLSAADGAPPGGAEYAKRSSEDARMMIKGS